MKNLRIEKFIFKGTLVCFYLGLMKSLSGNLVLVILLFADYNVLGFQLTVTDNKASIQLILYRMAIIYMLCVGDCYLNNFTVMIKEKSSPCRRILPQ